MAKTASGQAAERRYGRLNLVFWLAIGGIFLGPILAIILSVVVYQFSGANVSAPIGLTAPLWAVVAVAVALFVRGSRKAARRALDLALLAEQLGLEFVAKPPKEDFEFLSSISFMANPLTQKGENLLRGTPGGRAMMSLDYVYRYFYGAVTVSGEQTMVVFPNAFAHLPPMAIVPLGMMDQLADSLLGRGERISIASTHPTAVAFNQQFATVGNDPATVLSRLSPQFVELLLRDRLMNVVVEQGHLILFRRLTFVAAKDYQGFLSTAFQVAEQLG